METRATEGEKTIRTVGELEMRSKRQEDDERDGKDKWIERR